MGRVAWAVMLKDIRLRLRAPLAPLVFLAFPFIFSGLIALAFGGGAGRTPRFPLALVDEDGGVVARLVCGAFGQEQAARFLEVQEVDLAQAEALIRHDKVAGAIIIPKGFSTAVLKRQETELRVLRNPASAIGAIAVEQSADFIALLAESGAQLLAQPIDRVLAATQVPGDGFAPADMQVAEVAVLVNRAITGAARFIFPPAITLRSSKTVLGEDVAAPSDSSHAATAAGTGGGAAALFRHVLPAMATFALFMLAIGLTADLFREKSAGTLARMLALPVRASEVILGKLLATLVVGLLVAMAMALVGALLLGARANLLAFGLLCLAFLAGTIGFVTFLYSIAKDERQGGTITSIALMTMAFLGGSFIPLEALPRFVQGLAPLTLNYWAIRGFDTLLFQDVGVGAIVGPLVVCAAVGGVTVMAGGALLRRRFMRGA
jgi:ABC-2 type transport system permease protein